MKDTSLLRLRRKDTSNGDDVGPGQVVRVRGKDLSTMKMEIGDSWATKESVLPSKPLFQKETANKMPVVVKCTGLLCVCIFGNYSSVTDFPGAWH